jgi:FSR family fosmidomycin resistance protein-like MFS transporter
MSLIGIAPGYGFLMVLLLLAGISSAALHAVSPVIGSSFAGGKLGRSMSYWMVGGEMGRSLGPLIIVSAIEYLTPGQVPWLMIGGFMTSIFLYHKLRDVSTLPVEKQDFTNWKNAFEKIRRVMIPVTILVFSRAFVHAALTTYLPTYMTTQGSALWMAGASLTILQVAGMIGALLAGWLSDHFGRRIMLLISYITVPFLVLLFLNAKGLWQVPVLVLLGFFAIASVPIFLAVVMENSPENKSFANGVYMAVSFIINAISVLLVGALADFTNFQTTFLISAGLMALGLPFIFMLPKMKPAPKLAG